MTDKEIFVKAVEAATRINDLVFDVALEEAKSIDPEQLDRVVCEIVYQVMMLAYETRPERDPTFADLWKQGMDKYNEKKHNKSSLN